MYQEKGCSRIPGKVGMKRSVSLFLAAVIVLAVCTAFSGCSKKNYDLVLITDGGSVTNRAYAQSCWDGMCEFSIDHGIDCRYFIPSNTEKETLLSSIEGAIEGGAKTVVTAGLCFETAVYEASRKYPDVRFILIDGEPRQDQNGAASPQPNTAAVTFLSEQSGYMAGYAAVSDGYTKLGVISGYPTADTMAYACGFLQGAQNAAQLRGSNVDLIYHCTGDTLENDANEKTAAEMYSSGTELIFTCGGDVYKSVIKAAEEERGYVICSDADRRYDSSCVVTSAVKNVSGAVIRVLRSIYESKDFEATFGGRTTVLGAAENCTGLPESVINDTNGDPFDRFIRFTAQAYSDELARLASGGVSVKRSVTLSEDEVYPGANELTGQLGLQNVTVTAVQ